MKKTFVITSLTLLFAYSSQAQLVVLDNLNLVNNNINHAKSILAALETKLAFVENFAKSLEKAKKISEGVQNNYQFAKNKYNELKQVNSALSLYKKLPKLINSYKAIGDKYKEYVSKVHELKRIDDDTKVEILEGYDALLQEATKLSDDVKMASESSNLKLTDKERIDLIEKAQQKVKEHEELMTFYYDMWAAHNEMLAEQQGKKDFLYHIYGYDKEAK